MTDTTHRLRLNAYSVNDAGHIQCFRDNRPDEWAAVLRVDLERDTPTGREIVERLLALVDEPRALLGRAKNGSFVLLFRSDSNPVPYIQGSDSSRDGVFKLATQAGERFTVTCAMVGQALDVAGYTWPKGRSPLEISRDALPILTSDIGAAVMAEAFKVATWASNWEQHQAAAARLDQLRADLASGKIKILTDEERDAAKDEELVARYEGVELSMHDGALANHVISARRRVAHRKRLAAEAAIITTAA